MHLHKIIRPNIAVLTSSIRNGVYHFSTDYSLEMRASLRQTAYGTVVPLLLLLGVVPASFETSNLSLKVQFDGLIIIRNQTNFVSYFSFELRMSVMWASRDKYWSISMQGSISQRVKTSPNFGPVLGALHFTVSRSAIPINCYPT